MEKRDFLVIGLGNPGEQYCSNRHNVGFLVVDELASRWNTLFSQEKWDASYVSLALDGKKVHLLKPLTYMNRSGRAVASFVRFFKMQPDQLLVIHDDLDMAPGRIKLVKGGGTGGHNGIRSLVDTLGTNDFYRLKVGIGRPGQGAVHSGFPVDKYVLSNFIEEELVVLQSRLDSLEDGIRTLLQGNPAKAMTRLNGLK